MRITTNKTVLSAALGALLGATASSAHALAVLSWDLTDFDGDGLRSDMRIFDDPTGDGQFQFGFSPENGCVNAPGGVCTPISFGAGPVATDVFTTGFNFGGTGDWKPNVVGDLSADIAGGVLSFSALELGGRFPGPSGMQFYYMTPDDINAVQVETLTDLGNNQWGVVIRYIGTDDINTGPTYGFRFHWRLEGVMTTVPVPGAVWLLVSGLAGLFGFARRAA